MTVSARANFGNWNVLHFDANGDGTSNDTTFFRQAIARGLADGGKVMLPPGRYGLVAADFDAAVPLVGSSNLVIEGADPDQTVLTFVNDDINARLISLVDCNNITFRNLGFDGRRTAAAPLNYNSAVVVRGGNNIRFDNCRFVNTGFAGIEYGTHSKFNTGDDLVADASTRLNGLRIEKCRFENNYGYGAIVQGGGAWSNIKILNSDFGRFGQWAVTASSMNGNAPTEVCLDIEISGNRFDSGFVGSAGFTEKSVILAENEINGLTISRNKFRNVFRDVLSSAIDIRNTLAGTELSNFTVEQNQVFNFLGAGDPETSGILLNATEGTLSGGQLQGNIINDARNSVTFDTVLGGVIKEVGINVNTLRAAEIGVSHENRSTPLQQLAFNSNTIVGPVRGLRIEAQNSSIVGNVVRDPIGNPSPLAIEILAGSTNVTQADNTV